MERLSKYVEELTGSPLSDNQLQQFETYYDMLIETNKVMNLTAITERDEVILKHFMDSVALAGYHGIKDKALKVIDVGTGAGFPGIPLKIAFPKLNVTLFDSLNKRIKFLQSVIDELGLDGTLAANGSKDLGSCEAIHGRAEEGGRKKNMREAYDLVVSRAVANMSVLAEYTLPFVKEGGYFIPYKTLTVDEELDAGKKAISVLGGKLEKVEKLTLPDSDIGRSFVFIKKVKATPKAYPRKAGTASKQPL